MDREVSTDALGGFSRRRRRHEREDTHSQHNRHDTDYWAEDPTTATVREGSGKCLTIGVRAGQIDVEFFERH